MGHIGRHAILALAVTALLALAPSVHAAGPYVVNATSDLPDVNPGDGTCATSAANCTLRAAIQEANAPPASADTINFNITAAGVQTITLGSNLFVITDDVTIDATTQSGWVPNTNIGFAGGSNAALKVVLDANNKEAFAATKKTTVRGME